MRSKGERETTYSVELMSNLTITSESPPKRSAMVKASVKVVMFFSLRMESFAQELFVAWRVLLVTIKSFY